MHIIVGIPAAPGIKNTAVCTLKELADGLILPKGGKS